MEEDKIFSTHDLRPRWDHLLWHLTGCSLVKITGAGGQWGLSSKNHGMDK